MVAYEKTLKNKKYSENREKITPFGAQYLVEPASLIVSPLRDWKWNPQNAGIEKTLKINGTLSGTTGTGPTIREDEVRDEM